MKFHVTYTSQWSLYCWSFSVKVKFREVMHMLGHAGLRTSMEICVERAVAANAILRRGRAGAQISSTIRFISHLARPLAWFRSTRLPPLELRHKLGTWNAPRHCRWLKNSEFWGVCEGTFRKGNNVLWHPFHRNDGSIMKNMVVTYKVPYSISND